MEEKDKTLSELLSEKIGEKDFKTLRELLHETNPVDVAEALAELPERELTICFRMLDKDTASEVFSGMEPDAQELLIRSLSDKELKEIVDDMWTDDAADLVEEMPANVVSRILAAASPETRKSINELLRYPEDSVGSIMTPDYVTHKESMTVDEALAHIRKVGLDKETIYTCYVTEARKLIGVVSARSLLIADGSAPISGLMHRNFVSLNTDDDREVAASEIKKYGLIAMPAVDKEGRLVGIVTVDDAIDVLEEETTEDMEIMAAISPSEKPYLKTGVFETWKQRIPWLLLLMVSATFTGMIISGFEEALAACTALTAFIPMLMDTGGNSGSQSSVTIIRALALGDITPKDILKVIGKELRVAVLCGVTLAAANFVKIVLVEMLLFKSLEFSPQGFLVITAVCLTLLITILFAKLIGCSLPIAAKALKLDPAVMASPFITTAVDAISLIVYFFISTQILKL
ncbi:MAG: magnesium transporter [Clostridia bacterium]|nr:magnesium transporter [Clostridia bacterium]